MGPGRGSVAAAGRGRAFLSREWEIRGPSGNWPEWESLEGSLRNLFSDCPVPAFLRSLLSRGPSLGWHLTSGSRPRLSPDGAAFSSSAPPSVPRPRLKPTEGGPRARLPTGPLLRPSHSPFHTGQSSPAQGALRVAVGTGRRGALENFGNSFTFSSWNPPSLPTMPSCPGPGGPWYRARGPRKGRELSAPVTNKSPSSAVAAGEGVCLAEEGAFQGGAHMSLGIRGPC